MRLTMCVALAAAIVGAPAAAADRFRDLAELTLEELSTLTITSVARRETRLDTAPASIYVISAEDIRRSGATTLGEALRLAPNLQVARVSALDHAISARGFNNIIGNKLLVLIDGRTVYTSTFSGVFWEAQDVMLEDVERIEVISGPGVTMWGANAVNGVINVTTRSAADTQGALVTAEAGNRENGAAVRYGMPLGAGALRVYARARDLDANRRASDGADAFDDWDRWHAGFRADLEREQGAYTLLGEVFSGKTGSRGGTAPHEYSGYNLLGRWERGGTRVQAYWDHVERRDFLTFVPEIDTLDIEFQHAVDRGAVRMLWGGGYRRTADSIEPGLSTRFVPDARTLEIYSGFVQGEFRIRDDLSATVGLKLEHNDFTGFEHMPTVRLAWQPNASTLIWGAATRAIRTPSRFDRDLHLPAEPPFNVTGGPLFRSEVADVLELGFRGRSGQTLNWSATLFRHDWRHLRGGEGTQPILITNPIDGYIHGAEGWANWQAAPRWRLMAGALVQDKSLWYRADVTDTPVGVASAVLHNDPRYQLMVRSRADLGDRIEFDVHVRHVDRLVNQPVPAYTALDARIAWRLNDSLMFALVGRNLTGAHVEFGNPATRSEFDRSAMVTVRWRP